MLARRSLNDLFRQAGLINMYTGSARARQNGFRATVDRDVDCE